jgi:hypothetical protein
MTFERKLRTTLIQSFGTPVPVEPRRSIDSEDRLTAIGGTLPEEDRLPVEGDVIGGHYRLVRGLGAGMFGRVYLAERTDVPEHRVALKVINRAVFGGRDVERELVMLAATTHPHIVQLKDHGMTDDYVWLTMPLYEGETLAERLERGPLTLREAYRVFLPIAHGVHALHQRGLRHQDIKPENIYLAEIGGDVHPVLLDLGVAVESGSPFVAGTALYASPEQIVALGGLEGRGALSEKMDTYCLAATLLRSLVGPDDFPGERASSPFDIANAFEIREQSPLSDRVLTELTGDPRCQLQASFSRWLTRDPDARPDAGALADELEVLLEQEREAAAAIEAEIAQQKVALKRVRVALAAAAIVGTGVMLWGVAHRETLRLAQELERARAIGADSFDKLDTCIAAHQLAQHDAGICSTNLEEERTQHESALITERASHATASAALEKEVKRGSGRLRACVDEKHQAAQTCTTEQEQLTSTLAERDVALTTARTDIATLRKERDEQAAGRNTCQTQLDTVTAERGSCDAELATCVVERDVAKKAAVPVAAPTSLPATTNVSATQPAAEPQAPTSTSVPPEERLASEAPSP